MKSICWNITTRCNANCNFCNRMQGVYEICFELNVKILRGLRRNGVTKRVDKQILAKLGFYYIPVEELDMKRKKVAA